MKASHLLSLSLTLVGWLASCVNPINAHTAQRYYEAGSDAEDKGDVDLARRNYSRAYQNTKLGHLGPGAEAHALYEYARVTGHAGKHAEAERAFLEVLTLINKAKGSAGSLLAPTLSEYARLLHDTKQHEKAVPVYVQAVSELERLDILTIDPVGFALFLDDYADSLAVSGHSGRSAEIAKRSASIKATHPSTSAKLVGKRYRS